VNRPQIVYDVHNEPLAAAFQSMVLLPLQEFHEQDRNTNSAVFAALCSFLRTAMRYRCEMVRRLIKAHVEGLFRRSSSDRFRIND
jgi:hypothetical protein